MADNNKDIDKKLKTSAKPDGLPLPRSKPADAGASVEPKGFLDELENKMDDLFVLDEKAPPETKLQKQKGIEASTKKAEPEFKDHDAPLKTQVPKPAAEKARPTPAAASVPKAAKASIFKPAAPPIKKIERKSVGIAVPGDMKRPEAAAEKQKPFQPAAAQAALPPKKVTPQEDTDAAEPSGADAAVKPEPKAKRSDPLQKKEPNQNISGPVKKKHTVLKSAVAGIILVGSVLALFVFFKAPEPAPPIQSATAPPPQAHKIIKPPAKTPQTKATPPAVSSIPQQPDPLQIKPEFAPVAVSAPEKKPLPPAKPVAVSPEIAKPSPPVKPEMNAADEIKAFLQERKSYPYSIHNGSYRTLPAARESAEAFSKMGLEAYWAIVDLGEKGIWYRVFIGYYNNRESAQKFIRDNALKDVSPQETRYANRIGTYASEEDMQNQRRLLLKNGFAPYVIKDADGNLNLYAGAYVTRQVAEESSAELQAKGIPSRTVER